MRRAAGSDFDQLIHERMERAYKRVFGKPPGGHSFGTRYMEPPVDVYQTEDEIVVLMEIAGISDEEIAITLDGRTMLVEGERKAIPGRPNRVYSQIEITQGKFQREILLPAEVTADKLRAEYHNGILEIVLQKAEPSPGRRLRIVVR